MFYNLEWSNDWVIVVAEKLKLFYAELLSV